MKHTNIQTCNSLLGAIGAYLYLEKPDDAVHIAAAANVRIRREVERILAKHGYNQTTICTPEEVV